jgi:hypothetical protein
MPFDTAEPFSNFVSSVTSTPLIRASISSDSAV